MKKIITTLSIFMAISCLAFIMCACNQNPKDKYTGTYVGSAKSDFTLYNDGTAKYRDNTWSEGFDSTWDIKDNRLILKCERLGYEIYSDISNYEGSLLMTSDSGSWRDEIFIKTAIK